MKDLKKSNTKQSIKLMGFLILSLYLSILSACKTIQYIPVETVKVEHTHSIDSIYKVDSVLVEKLVKQDTVYLTKYKYQYKEIIKVDTILKVDSIPYIQTVEKIIKVNKQNKWQTALECIGGITCILIIGLSLFKIKRFII